MTKTRRKPLMAVRLLITDAIGEEIASRLASINHKAGSPPELSEQGKLH
jgi:hypothetical protein